MRRHFGQQRPPMPIMRQCGGIAWRRVSDEIGELKRMYSGLPLPGKPRPHKDCAWALEAAIGKYEEALLYRSRGACEESEEYALDAIRYRGVFMGCQMMRKAPKKRKRKASKKRKR